MEKYLFVLLGNEISQWKFEDGLLQPVTNEGRRWLVYDNPESYWQEWKADNQFREGKDAIDAIFLSDAQTGFPGLPAWLLPEHPAASTWTFEMMSELSADSRVIERKILVSQGAVSRSFGNANGEELVFHLSGLLTFNLPKEQPKPVVTEPPKPKVETVLIKADCLVDEKSKEIEAGATITLTVNAFSKFRGCFLDCEAAGDQLRILPEECQKDEFVGAILKKPGKTLTAKIGEVSKEEGLINLTLIIVK